MSKTTEEIVQAQADAVKAASSAAQKTLEGFQKLSALNFQTAKASLETSTEQIKALLAAKDLKSVTELVTSFAKPSADKFVAYAKAVYAVSSETSSELVELVRTQVEKGNHQMLAQVQELAKSTPAGSEGAVNFVKQVLTVANSSYDQLNAATKGFVDASAAGVSAVAPAAVAAAATVTPVSSKSAKA